MGQFAIRVQGADAKTNSSGYAGSLVVSAGPARFYTATIYNNFGGDVYIQVFDAVAVPSTGAWSTPPLLIARIPNASQGGFDFSDGCLFPTGVSIALSTTATDYTAAPSAAIIYATYRRIQ